MYETHSDLTPLATIIDLLGSHPSSPKIARFLVSVCASQDNPDVVPEVKSYPDAVYYNYHALGLSFCFSPIDGYNPKTGQDLQSLQQEYLVLDSIFIYNASEPLGGGKKSTSSIYSTYPLLPLVLPITPTTLDGKSRESTLEVKAETSGKQFVEYLGEPDRKGGGSGPSAGSIGIWCEWSKDGIMVEFGGEEAKGPKAWETGKDATWKVITLFPSKS